MNDTSTNASGPAVRYCPLCGSLLGETATRCPGCRTESPPQGVPATALTSGRPVARSAAHSEPGPGAEGDGDLKPLAGLRTPTFRLERCLKCGKNRAGQSYPFYVGVTDGACLNVRQEASAFLCHGCAAEHLGLNPCQLWPRLFLAAAVGSLVTLLAFALGGFLAVLPLTVTGLAVWRIVQQLSFAYRKEYRWHPFAVHLVTRLIIRLCRQEFVGRLGLPEGKAVFLSRPEYLRKFPARQAAGSRGWLVRIPRSAAAPGRGTSRGAPTGW
jgi:hypothetical protein